MVCLYTSGQVRLAVGAKFALTDYVNIEIGLKWYNLKHKVGNAFNGLLVRHEVNIITWQALEVGKDLVEY